MEKNTVIFIFAVVLAISSIVGQFICSGGMTSMTSIEDSIEQNGNAYAEEEKIDDEVVVHIKGAIKNPGLYSLESGKRVDDAIKIAGGPTSDANIQKINLAQVLIDEMEITIPSFNDPIDYNNGKININTADAKDFEKLSGVGEVTARKIVDYREELGGRFNTINDLLGVDGIGLKKFEGIKDYVFVQ